MKIAIIFPESYLDSLPCLISFIELLSRQSIEIDIYSSINSICSPPKFTQSNVNLLLNKTKYPLNFKRYIPTTIYRLWDILKFVYFFIEMPK
jgi:hypothetical protein